MKFSLVLTATVELQNKYHIIYSLSDNLKDYFKNKDYGDDLEAYTIGIVCVSPNFEKFFLGKKPKYTRGPKVIVSEGVRFTIEKSLEYSITLDFNQFSNATEETGRKILVKEILLSLSILDNIKSKIKNFFVDKFKDDLKKYFIDYGLL